MQDYKLCMHPFYSTPQTLFTVIFFASFHEFVRDMKVKVPKWWAKRRRQPEGEVSLTEMHDDEGIVSHLPALS